MFYDFNGFNDRDNVSAPNGDRMPSRNVRSRKDQRIMVDNPRLGSPFPNLKPKILPNRNP